MDPHRIEIFDGADDHDVVLQVAHHFKFELFPSKHRLFHQDLVDRTAGEPMLHLSTKLLHVIRGATSRPSKRERGADDNRETDLFSQLHRFVERMHERASSRLQSDLVHRLLEQLPVLCSLDRLQLRPDQLDAILRQNTAFRKGNGRIQGRLSPHGREDDIRSLFFYNLFDECGGNWFHVGGVGKLRVGHDRGGIAVDQDDPVSFFAQNFAGLRARIVKFARLADHNGAGTDDEDGVNICAFWQFLLPE